MSLPFRLLAMADEMNVTLTPWQREIVDQMLAGGDFYVSAEPHLERYERLSRMHANVPEEETMSGWRPWEDIADGLRSAFRSVPPDAFALGFLLGCLFVWLVIT